MKQGSNTKNITQTPPKTCVKKCYFKKKIIRIKVCELLLFPLKFLFFILVYAVQICCHPWSFCHKPPLPIKNDFYFQKLLNFILIINKIKTHTH